MSENGTSKQHDWAVLALQTWAVVSVLLILTLALVLFVDTYDVAPIKVQQEHYEAQARKICEIRRLYAVAPPAERPLIRYVEAQAIAAYEDAAAAFNAEIARQEANINDNCDPAKEHCQIVPSVPVRAPWLDASIQEHCWNAEEW